jgi:hypothetical protein
MEIEDAPSRATHEVQYLVRPTSHGFELVRKETHPFGAVLELTLLRSPDEPQIEFLAVPTKPGGGADRQPPCALKLSIATRTVLVRL